MATKSTFEDKIIAELKEANRKFKYEPIKIKYVIEANYIPDLVLGNGIIVELKGYFRVDAMTKMIAVKKANPTLDIRFVFMSSKSAVQGAKVRKNGTKMTCGEFAEKHGFPYAEKHIPTEWFN